MPLLKYPNPSSPAGPLGRFTGTDEPYYRTVVNKRQPTAPTADGTDWTAATARHHHRPKPGRENRHTTYRRRANPVAHQISLRGDRLETRSASEHRRQLQQQSAQIRQTGGYTRVGIDSDGRIGDK